MRVLFITHCLAMAGANRSMLQLMLELRNRYLVEPYVLIPINRDDEKFSIKFYLLKYNIQFWEIEIPSFKQEKQTVYNRFFFWDKINLLPAVCEQLQEYKFDFIHSNSSTIDIGGYLSRILGVKHIWHLREFGDLDYSVNSIWGSLYERLTYRNSDAFIAISNAIKLHYSRKLPSEKIKVVYNGIKFDPNIRLADHHNKIIQFVCAGVLNNGKNQLEILEAANILIREHNVTNFHLTFIGRPLGDYINTLKLYIHVHSLENYVSFPGEVEDIQKYLYTMDVGIMSSNREAFGRVTIEYMVQNLAVIANDQGANKEIIADGDSGLIYTSGNSHSLAQKMQLLIEDRGALLRLAKKGNETASTYFRSEYNTENIWKLYDELSRVPSGPCCSLSHIYSYWLLCLLYNCLLFVVRIKRRLNIKVI